MNRGGSGGLGGASGGVAGRAGGGGSGGMPGGASGSGGTTAQARSCQELFSRNFRTDGAYPIDPDGAGGNQAFTTFCEMNARDQIGWTLIAKVQTASVDGVNEPRSWFVTESNSSALTTRSFNENQPPASHGSHKFASLVTASSIARFELYAALDLAQTATWYKVVTSAKSLRSWFTPADTTASRVCANLALTLNCSNATIAPLTGDATTYLGGMQLNPYGYSAYGPIHMRLNDDVSPEVSGVCSYTLDNDMNRWRDSYSTHWGNGLLIWLN